MSEHYNSTTTLTHDEFALRTGLLQDTERPKARRSTSTKLGRSTSTWFGDDTTRTTYHGALHDITNELHDNLHRTTPHLLLLSS
eukprot:4279724-Amphidinium_carterae.1